MLSEISQTESQKLHDITYMWNIKCNTNACLFKTEQTHRQRKQTCGYQRGEGRGSGTN